jgi:hypothetical protein
VLMDAVPRVRGFGSPELVRSALAAVASRYSLATNRN